MREVEAAVQRNRVTTEIRSKFQVVALLAREERGRVKADTDSSEAHRAEQLKRLDGIGTILAKTAARHPTFFELLDEGAELSWEALEVKREMQKAAGLDPEPDPAVADAEAEVVPTERQVVPRSVVARQLAHPFQAPDFAAAAKLRPASDGPGRLAGWELISPLLESFERASGGAKACMALPEPESTRTPGGQQLMRHQAQLVASAAAGHRSYLLADEPGLGKTAQALLAAWSTT